MRRIFRKKLSAQAAAYLDKQTERILAAPPGKRKALARKLFDQARKTKAFAEIRTKLQKMATGRRRCGSSAITGAFQREAKLTGYSASPPGGGA